MRSYVHHNSATRSASPRRTASRSLPTATRPHIPTRTRAEHAEIARASSAWEHEVAQGLQAFIGQTIPLDAQERLTVTHVLNLAEDETFAGWYNWRGITNPDMVLLGILVGGPDNDATAAIAVDAKLSARSTKTQVLTQTLAQLFEPFQPLTNLVDALLGDGASERLILRNGFHVVRGVATTIGTAAKTTRALLDPEYAAEFVATQPVSLRPRHHRTRPQSAAAAPLASPRTRVTPPVNRAASPTSNHAALFTEAVWSLDRLSVAGVEMPEPRGVYHLDDVLALDDREGTPAEIIILGTHGSERVAQAIVLGAKRALPNDHAVRAYLADFPIPIGNRFRVVPAFRVCAGKADTLAVLGNRRTVVLPT
ncbi:MAG: hypothetical protein ACR2M3_10240 [Thermomicrobiales bacterium]